jgi:hypothetical protein
LARIPYPRDDELTQELRDQEDLRNRVMYSYGDEMERRAADPNDQLFKFFDRVSTGMDNNVPGMERAHGMTQRHLHDYYITRARHNALTRGR